LKKDPPKSDRRFDISDILMMPMEGSTLKPTTAVDTTAWTNRANIVVPGVVLTQEQPSQQISDESDEEVSDEAMLARHQRALMKEQRKNMAHLLHDD